MNTSQFATSDFRLRIHPPSFSADDLERLRLSRILRPDHLGGRTSCDRRRDPRSRRSRRTSRQRAKRVIFLCMHGAPSHVDTFDYKPKLDRRQRQGIRPRSRRSGDAARLAVEVLPARAERAVDFRAVSRTWRSTRTTSASCVDAHRPAEPPAGRQRRCTPAAPSSSGRRSARGRSTASARRTRTCPASSPSTRRSRAAARRTTAAPSSPRSTRAPRSAPAIPARSGPQRRGGGGAPTMSNISNPRYTADAQRTQLDFIQSLNTTKLAAGRLRPADRRRHREPTNSPSACRTSRRR